LRKGVEPENAKHHHFGDHFWGEPVERGNVVSAARSFFHGAYAPLDVWDVFILSTNVQFGSYVGSNGAPSALEFAVSKDSGDSGTPFPVYAMDFFQRCDDRLLGPVVPVDAMDFFQCCDDRLLGPVVPVDAMDFFQRCDDRLLGPVVESSSGDELDILRYG
jgi:hypothetical protein